MVEVMVAMMLTAIAMSGVLGLYMTTTRASGFSRHATEASVLGEDQLERLRTVAAPVQMTTVTQTSLDENGKVVPGGLFTRSWVLTPAATYIDVMVAVSWNDEGVIRQVVLRSRRNL